MGTQTLTGRFVLFAWLLCGSIRAFAASATTNCVSEAEPDPTYGATTGGHALYLPGIGTDFVFTTVPGSFVQFSDGTAVLTGNVFSKTNSQKGFAIDVRLSGYRATPPSGSPKKDLSSNAYDSDGPVDTDTWIYYTNFSGTLTGLSNYAGAVLSIVRTGPSFQVGFGANGKNVNFGASSWFNWTVTNQPNSGGSLTVTGQGDFNIDLFTCLNGGEQCATNAYPNATYSTSERTHAVYLPGLVEDLIFTPAARFAQSNDGTATLTGLATSRANPGKAFQVSVQLSGYTTNVPPGSPHKQLKSSAYIENGGPVNPATWSYYTTFKGTLTGVSNYAGAVLNIERTGPAFQIGVGANGKNLNYGASSWFEWTVAHQPNSGGSLTSSGQGDFNLDLMTCEPPLIVIVTPPANQTNCPGGTATFSVTATGSALTYQWTFGGTPLPGATNSTVVISNVSTANAGTYCVIVRSAGNAVTNCALLVVNQNTLVTIPPRDQAVCVNGTALFRVTATGTALTYQWYFGTSPLANQTTSTLVLSNVTTAQAGVYSVVVSGACGPSVTNSATLTVNQNVIVSTAPANQTNFIGGNATFTVVAAGTDLSYQWLFNGSMVGTNSTLMLNNITTGQAGTYCIVVSGTCGKPVTNCAVLVVLPRPNQPPVVSIVNPTNGTMFFAPATFTVIAEASDVDGVVTNVQIFRGTNFSATNLLGTFTNAPYLVPQTNLPVGTYTYGATATDNGGLSATSNPVTVTVTTGPPVTVLGPIALNRQNGLFEQFARVSNSTPNDLLGGVRIFAHLPTNDTTNVVWNATGKTNGIPFIDSLTPLLAGGYVDVLIQYYVPNPRSVPTVTLTAEPIPFTPPPVPRPRVVSVSQNGNATTIEFTTVRNCLYYLQSSEDLVHWITVSGLMHGTGERMQCTDSPGRSRQFYRTIAIR